MSITIKKISPLAFQNLLRASFNKEMGKQQKKYVSFSDNLYSNTSAFPGYLFYKGDHFYTQIKLYNPKDGHHIYAEFGTGVHMPSWWSPHATDARAGTSRVPRPGKKIGIRGKGNSWVDLAMKGHPGSDYLRFRGRGGWVTLSPNNKKYPLEGMPGKHKLKKKTKQFWTKNKLKFMAKQALRNTTRSAIREVTIIP